MRLVRGGLSAAAAWFLGAFVAVAGLRIGTPYELEWMEGGMVDHVRRVLAGHQLYRPPSLAFTPYLYTPLYSYVAAPVAWVLGVGYLPLRLVSLVSALATMAVIAWWVRRETGSWWAGFVGAGLFASTFRVGGSWLDLARVDSLFLALLVGGLALARFAGTRRRAALAAVVLVLAVLAKQEALLPALAPIPFLWRRGRGVAVTYASVLAGGLLAVGGAMELASGGWFLYYVIEVPLAHNLLSSEVLGFWTRDMAKIAAATLVAAIGLVLSARADRAADGAGVATDVAEPAGRRLEVDAEERLWFLVPVWLAAVASAWSGRLHTGGFDNVLLPVLAMTALMAGIGAGAVLATGPRHPTGDATGGRPAGAAPARWAVGLVAVLVAVQFATLVYDPASALPPSADRHRADELLATLRRLPGPVYLPGHGWYLARAGRPTGAQSAAIADVLRGPAGAGRHDLDVELRRMVSQRRFGSVVVDSDRVLSYLPRDFDRYYCQSRKIYRSGRLTPIVGTPSGPLTVWLPRAHPGADTPVRCADDPSAGDAPPGATSGRGS